MPSDLASEVASLDADDFAALLDDLDGDEAAVLEVVRARARTDRDLFVRTCFADRVDLDWSPVHRDFLEHPKTGWRERTEQEKLARIAPRGSAKSTLGSFAEILHDVAYALEVCVHIYSTGYRLAETLVEDLHTVLTTPDAYPEYHALYGPVRVVGTKTNFVVHVRDGEPLGTRVTAMSFGGDARGYKHAGKRPSKIVLDDTVNPKHVRNPDQRDAHHAYLRKDIEKAGSRYTVLHLVGTVVHPDDLVARVRRSPDWYTREWRNLVAWPTRMDLWEDCRKVWADLANPNRLRDARAFYAAHQAEMDAGAEVLWPEGRPLYDLMTSFWASPASFWSEDQNSPRDLDSMLFDADRWRRCRLDGQTIRTSRGTVVQLSACTLALWLDPSSGGDKSDHPALALVARDPAGYRYAIGAEITRRQPSAQQETLWAWWERYAHTRPKVGYDETGTQSLMGDAWERQREERRVQGKAWQMPIRGYKLTDNKLDRIASLEPLLANGWLELAEDLPGVALDQLRDFPTATHDDYPDALERACWLVGESNAVSITKGFGR